MKTSNKILLIAAGSVFALVLLCAIIYRITTVEPIFSTQIPDKFIPTNEDKITKSYDLNDFTELAISGSWAIKVRQAATYQVTVRAPANLLGYLDVTKMGKTLNLGNTVSIRLLSSSERIEAEITLPVLTKIQGSGAAQLDVRGFTTDELTLSFSGAGQLAGSDNRIKQLFVDCSGAADLDLNQSTVTNADLNVSGAAQIKMNMAGGKLTGQISGLANITYTGSVLSEDVKTSGMAKVTKRD